MASSKNRFWTLGALLAFVWLGIIQAGKAEPAPPQPLANPGSYFETQVDPTADTNFSLALFRMWVPSTKGPLKGILAVLPGSDAHGTPLADDPQWQAVASDWNYALLGITFTTLAGAEPYHRAHKGSGQALLTALEKLAVSSPHPELANIPIAILGHSQGGQFAYHFACWKPERVVAFATIKGGYHEAIPNVVAKAVPGLLISGEKDSEFRQENIRRTFALNHSPPGRWCYALEPEVGHALGHSLDLILPFFAAVIRGDLQPTIGNPETLILQSVATVPSAPAVWLPSASGGEQWVQFMRGTLPETLRPFAIPNQPPPSLAEVSPNNLDFGEMKNGVECAPKTVRICPSKGSPPWDEVRAFSLKSMASVSVSRSGEDWSLSVQPYPTPAQHPLGRLRDVIVLRFSQAGKPVLGGSAIGATLRWVHDAIDLSPFYFYIGTHSEACKKSVRVTARTGALLIREASLVSGTAATLRIIPHGENSAELEATFVSLPESGPHSGSFSLWLEKPIRTQITVPFIGHFKK